VLPPNYPQQQPYIFIKKHMEYTPGPTKHWIRTSSAPGHVPDPETWARWCIHDVNWNPARHSLTTMMKHVSTNPTLLTG
jgi:hypothetical protein